MYYKELMDTVIDTVKKHDIDLNSQMGHLVRIKERENGKNFNFSDHLRGLIYSQLSNQRPWHHVQKHLSDIDLIFFNYDADKILKQDYHYFVREIKALKCGNISIEKQMKYLNDNILRLREIEQIHGSLDNFVQIDSPVRIAYLLSSNKKYKIKYVGMALALEYLRNVGINEIKPDVHIKRIISNHRLSLVKNNAPTAVEAINAIKLLSQESGLSVAEVDAYLWLYCASGYCNICSAEPQCDRCGISKYCRFQGQSKIIRVFDEKMYSS